jgi:hypothetical protein
MSLSDVEICLVIMPGEEAMMGIVEDSPDPDDWMKLSAVHCQATQSVLTFLCGTNGRSRAVKFEKCQQPCVTEAAPCREAAKTKILKVGKLEHAVIMNETRSQLGGDEDCHRGCGYRVEFLDRKVTQVLMEILVKKEWIWWSKMARRITTASGKIALVREDGQAVMEEGLRLWEMPSRVGGVEFPTAGGGPALLN